MAKLKSKYLVVSFIVLLFSIVVFSLFNITLNTGNSELVEDSFDYYELEQNVKMASVVEEESSLEFDFAYGTITIDKMEHDFDFRRSDDMNLTISYRPNTYIYLAEVWVYDVDSSGNSVLSDTFELTPYDRDNTYYYEDYHSDYNFNDYLMSDFYGRFFVLKFVDEYHGEVYSNSFTLVYSTLEDTSYVTSSIFDWNIVTDFFIDYMWWFVWGGVGLIAIIIFSMLLNKKR